MDRRGLIIKYVAAALIIATLLYVGYLYSEKNSIAKHEKGMLSAHFIDVGQGSASLIITPDKKTVLIDCGPQSASHTLVSYLNRLGIKRIDHLILTHFDKDHVSGIFELADYLSSVGTLYIPCYPKDDPFADSVIEAAEKISESTLIPSFLQKSEISTELSLTFLSQEKISENGGNSDSIICLAKYGELDILYTGDATIENEAALLTLCSPFPDCDVMTASHHGSKDANSFEFIKAADPEYVIISCGALNSYGHPSRVALENFERVANSILRTDTNGSIILYSNGKSISFDTEK